MPGRTGICDGAAAGYPSASTRPAGLRHPGRENGSRRGACGVEGTQNFRVGGSSRSDPGAGHHSETGSKIRSETNHSRF